MQATTNQVNPELSKPVLKEGAKGEAVKELQRLLNKYNYALTVDGIFGRYTTQAVKQFQRRVFLSETGIVEDRTWRALYKGGPVDMPVLKRGSKGQFVIIVQQKLSFTGDYKGQIDGDFGPRIEAAVRVFQQRQGLVADGIVGDRTWFELSKIFEYDC